MFLCNETLYKGFFKPFCVLVCFQEIQKKGFVCFLGDGEALLKKTSKLLKTNPKLNPSSLYTSNKLAVKTSFPWDN